MGIMDKLKDAIGKNPDKSRQAARKGADVADKKELLRRVGLVK